MKRFLALLLCLTLVVGTLAGCNGGGGSSTSSGGTSSAAESASLPPLLVYAGILKVLLTKPRLVHCLPMD